LRQDGLSALSMMTDLEVGWSVCFVHDD